MSATQEFKIYLSILFVRIQKEHFASIEWVDKTLLNNEQLVGSSKTIVNRLIHQLINQLAVSDEIARVEARHFLVFLYALGIFSNTEECLCLTDDLIEQQNRLVEMVLDEVQMLGEIKFSQLQNVRLGSYLEPKLIQLSVK